VLSRLSYTLDDTGRRTAITEANGRNSSYGYDKLYRLTSESIIDADVGNHTASFTYDEVSNRIEQLVFRHAVVMSIHKSRYRRHRFPPVVISHQSCRLALPSI